MATANGAKVTKVKQTPEGVAVRVESGAAVAVVGLTSARLPSGHKLDVEPNSDQTLVEANRYEGNGRKPHPIFLLATRTPGGDLFWDGSGAGNRWREPADLKAFPADLLGPAASSEKLPHEKPPAEKLPAEKPAAEKLPANNSSPATSNSGDSR